MSSEEFEIPCTPPEIRERAIETTLEILPNKSRHIYNRQHDLFTSWCDRNNIKKISENVLLTYFSEKSKEYKAATLWSYYSMLKASLSVKNDVDISQYKKLTAFLKQKSKNYTPKKSKVLTQEEIIQFLLNAPNEIYLMMKICVIFGVAGACRNNELVNLKVDDIEDKDTVLIVHIRHTKTNKPRVFVVTSEFEGHVKPIELYKKYAKLRPAQTKHDRFFITYRKSKCTVQPVGIHTFGNIPCKIANYLNLPNPSEYTGHCFRRSSATLFANAGGSKENLKRHGGWKSDTVAESYVEESILNKTKIAKTILGGDQIAHRFDINDNTATTLHQNENIHFLINNTELHKDENTLLNNIPQNFSVDGSTSGINLNIATGCTINFNIYNK